MDFPKQTVNRVIDRLFCPFFHTQPFNQGSIRPEKTLDFISKGPYFDSN